MTKVQNILQYYLLTNRLKYIVRDSWKLWGIKKKRVESVAEHIYGSCMLAISIWSETLPHINIADVLMILALHESEKAIMGDISEFSPNYKEKKKFAEQKVEEVFKSLIAKDVFIKIVENYNKKSTKESIFAFKCAKLEQDIQAKIYEEEKVLEFENIDNEIKNNINVKKLTEKGLKKSSQFIILSDRAILNKLKTGDDDIFLKISKYIESHNLLS